MSILERDVVALRSGMARCDVVPHVGGAIAGFWSERGAERIDWLRPASAADVARGDAAAMGCFPLVPWGNRIRDGRFNFCGREVAGEAGNHALHGHGWRRPWEVTERTPGRLVLEYLHEPDAFPWRYRARQIVSLAGEGLSLTLALENLSDDVMPAGLGFHPFFPRPPELLLEARTRGVWLTDGDKLPSRWIAVPPEWDFAARRPLDGLALDNVFTGWDGRATLAWPGRAAHLVLDGEWPILSFLTIYAPAGEDFFCVEPASHCADAVNLARSGAAETGLRILAPGTQRSARLVLRPSSEWH